MDLLSQSPTAPADCTQYPSKKVSVDSPFKMVVMTPHVGIIFLYAGRLHIDMTPITAANSVRRSDDS